MQVSFEFFRMDYGESLCKQFKEEQVSRWRPFCGRCQRVEVCIVADVRYMNGRWQELV